MKIINAPENNCTLSPPKDWDEEAHGPCETITVFRDDCSFTVTLELEQREFAALLNGGKLKLRIFGNGFPPIALGVVP